MNNRPNINVTPLIDVLLVLLIIFMIITPVKPTDFKAKIPNEPKQNRHTTDPLTLVVSLDANSTLRLNDQTDVGNLQEPDKLIETLSRIFKDRADNRVYAESSEFRTDLTEPEKIQKTVFIKAPRNAGYGSVVKIIDSVKRAGASPISLQIDELD